MVLRRCRTLLRDEDAAVDAMHDAFVRLVRAAPRLDERGVNALLYQIATQVSLDRLRQRRRKPTEASDEVLLAIAATADLEGETITKQLLAQAFHLELPSTRSIAVLHFVDGLTHEEVAHIVGLSVSAVRKRLRGLTRRLQERGSAGGQARAVQEVS